MVNLLTPGELERSRKVYQQLGLQDFANPEEIKKAYRNLALLNHPDKNQNDPDAINRFRLINEAYQILSDETKKKKYDTALQSAYSAHQLFGGIPTSARQAAAQNNNNNYTSAAGDSSYAGDRDPTSTGNSTGGAVPTPHQFRDQMNSIPKRRHASAQPTASHQRQQQPTSPTQPNSTSATPTTANSFSTEQNEEYKRKEKARFAEMKRRLEQERAQQQELELQRLQKQQNEQRREQQRRQREQERIRGKLDKALNQTTSAAPFQRVGSSQNIGNSSSTPTPAFRSASSNNRGMNTKSLNLTGSANVTSPVRQHANNLTRTRSANSHALLPDYSSMNSNNNNNQQNQTSSSSIAGAHSHSKHSTFANRRSMSPIGSPTSQQQQLQRKRVQLQEANANTTATSPRSPSANSTSSRNLDDSETAMFVSPPPSAKMRRPLAVDSTNASPEMVELTRKQIEKDLENLPIEENEEREHFLKLQERHERAIMVSKFKQDALTIETEVRFRDFYDAETRGRFVIDCACVVERSAIQIENQCFMKMQALMTEASRQGRGIFAWHENIWAHMKQNHARLMLIAEREELQRSAIIEEQERRESAVFHIHSAALNRKFRVFTFEEDSARQTLYTNFYLGARMIEASRKMINDMIQPIYREESLARERLALELEETKLRGELYTANNERYHFIVQSRTTAISSYINELNQTILSMTDKITNHEKIVSGMKDTIDMHKQDNAREREEHESQIAMMRGDIEALESKVAKLRKDLLSAEERNVEEQAKYEKLMEDKKVIEKKFSEVRLTVAMEHEEEMKKVKEDAEKRDQERLKEIEQEREKHDALAEKFDKLRGKHAEAADFLKEMMERDEKQRAEIEKLRKELMMVRDLESIENTNNDNNNNNNNNNNTNNNQDGVDGNATGIFRSSNQNSQENLADENENDENNAENASERSGSQVSVFEVGNNNTTPSSSRRESIAGNQQQQQQKSGPGGSVSSTPKSFSVSKTSNNNTNTNTNASKNKPFSSNGLNQTPGAASSASSPRRNFAGATTNSAITTPRTQQQQQQQTPDSTIANRHTRSAKLEHRLYTAAAAASAASVAMAQKEGGNSSGMIKSRTAMNRSLMNTSNNNSQNNAVTPPRQTTGKQSSATTPSTTTTTPPPPGRPPLSPSASKSSSAIKNSASSSSSFSAPRGNNNNNNNNSSNTNNNNSGIAVDPHASYRELSAQARPKTVRQVLEWEEDDAAAVAQRAAVAAFLQKQQGALLHDYSDDPKNAELHVRSPVPGRGLLEYAGISNNSSQQRHHQDPSASPASSSSECVSCEINNGAVSRLVSTTDKLLVRNTGLVDDNEKLAHAVVAMNQQREKNAVKKSPVSSK